MNTAQPGAEIVLRLDRISKNFGAHCANDAISLDLKKGEVVALLGENGAGKTTLMNILFGHYVADDGLVEVFGRTLPPGNPRAALAAGIGMVHQHFTLAGNLSVLDNITLGTESLWSRGRGRASARAKVAMLSRDFGLAVHPDARVGRLSVGERQRVEILKALYHDARILILDEPTAVLTPQEAQALFATLRRATAMGLSIIFISHKLHEVLAIADRCIVLRQGKVVGEVDTSGTDKAQLAALMVGSELSLPRAEARAPGPALLQLDRVTTSDRGAVLGLKQVTLTLHSGQITGLAGVSGNGQAAIAELVAGLALPAGGTLSLKGEVLSRWSPRMALARGVARIPEDRHQQGTIADFNLTENAVLETYATPRFSRQGWMNWRAAKDYAEEIVAGYDVRCPGPDIRIRLLSGGNMQKLILGRAMTGGAGPNGPEIILANQPVRGLDVGAIAFVQGQLIAARDRGAAILLISEDLDEIIGLSDTLHVISQGRLSPAFARGTMAAADLGLWMAGQNFGAANAA